jgi:hypothetical protein
MASRFNQAFQDAKDDIFALCKIMRFDPTAQQGQLLQAVQRNTFAPVAKRKKGIMVASGQGTGKTAASVVAITFRVIQDIDEQGIVSAPTMRQVRDVWMTEATRRIRASDPDFAKLFKIGTQKITLMGRPKWGVHTATATKPENFQGYHSRGLTVLFDEASGIARPIWQTAKGTTTQEDNMLLGIGNPNDRDTEFFDAFHKDRDLYTCFNWSGEDSPNVSKKHIQDMEDEYGRESDVFRVRVLGQFPLQSPNSVIAYEDLLYASRGTDFNKKFKERLPGEESSDVRQIGIDWARFGSDESVAIARMNGAMVGMKIWNKTEPGHVADAVFKWQDSMGWKNHNTQYVVDAGGIGQGVLHKFYDSGKRVHEFHSNGVPNDSDQFDDCATESYFNLRVLTRAKLLHLKFDTLMFQQLTSRQYQFSKGRGSNLYKLESKDEFLKRQGTEEFTSPDRADALAMAFYQTSTKIQM